MIEDVTVKKTAFLVVAILYIFLLPAAAARIESGGQAVIRLYADDTAGVKNAVEEAVNDALEKASSAAAVLGEEISSVDSIAVTDTWTSLSSGDYIPESWIESATVKIICTSSVPVLKTPEPPQEFNAVQDEQMSGLISSMTVQKTLINVEDEVFVDEELEEPAADFLMNLNSIISPQSSDTSQD